VTPVAVVPRATQDAMIRRLVRPEDLACVLERVGRRGRRGTAALRSVLEECASGARLESRLEHALLDAVRSCALPPPVPQYELTCSDGRRVRLDLAWPEPRIAVEADGRRWHATAEDFERDRTRGNSIAASGWTLYRFGWADLHERRAAVQETLLRALRPAA
jgi:hypothetical protein